MRHAIHKIICWYLKRCGGAFHCYNYGPNGRYAVMMNERQYHRYMACSHDDKTGEQIMGYRNLMRSIDEDARNSAA